MSLCNVLANCCMIGSYKTQKKVSLTLNYFFKNIIIVSASVTPEKLCEIAIFPLTFKIARLQKNKDGISVRCVSMVRYASVFAKKHGTLVQYAFFAMVRLRYVGTLYEFAY